MMASTVHTGSRGSGIDFINAKWPRLFFLTVLAQAIIGIVFEAYVFGRFQSSVDGDKVNTADILYNSYIKTIPTFLTLFIFGFIYELILTWDALRMKNTIQVIVLCVANVALLIYAGLQYDQIMIAVQALDSAGYITPVMSQGKVWEACRAFLVVIAVIVAIVSVMLALMAWKLYQVFAWDILKQIGADYRMKKRFLHYQIYIALIKFDFFFFLGFTVQFLVIVQGKTNTEFGLTVAAIPVTIGILLCAAYFTRRENRAGMCVVILLYFGGLAYFFFKLVRIYQPGYASNYEAVRKSLTTFAVLTIILIILTIINAFICMNNFGAGLKVHLVKPAGPDPEKFDVNSYQMGSIGGDPKPLPTRMTID